MDGPGSPREKSIVSLISDGLKLEFAAGDPAGGLRTNLFNCLISKFFNLFQKEAGDPAGKLRTKFFIV